MFCVCFTYETTQQGYYFAVPSPEKFTGEEDDVYPGEVIFGDGNIVLNSGRKAVIIKVSNTGDRPVQVFVIIL